MRTSVSPIHGSDLEPNCVPVPGLVLGGWVGCSDVVRPLRVTRSIGSIARRGATALLMASALMGGCEGDDSEGPNAQRFEGQKKPVAAVVDALQEASRTGDAARICEEIFTERLAAEVARETGGSCGKRAERQLLSSDATFGVRDLRVQTAEATATVRERNNNLTRLLLVKQDGTWRIDDIAGSNRRAR